MNRRMAALLLPAALGAGAWAQTATTSALTVSGSDPYNLSCAVTGTAVGTAGPTGGVTFTDTTANNSWGGANLGAAALTPQFTGETVSTGISGPASVASFSVGDFNGDGTPDLALLVVTSFNSTGTVVVATGNGDGTFAAGTAVGNIASPGAAFEHLVSGDFNGDGKTDLALLYSLNGAQSIVVFLNQGGGTFAAQAPTTFALPSSVSGIVAVDFSSNGTWGLVLGDANSGTVYAIASNSTGTLQAPVTFTVSGNTIDLVTASFTGTSRTDVGVTTTTGVAVLANHGDGTFGSPVETSLGYPSGQPVAADYTGDGKVDLLVYDAGAIHLLSGNGDGTFGVPGTLVLTQASYMVGGDFNGDGKPDLALETLDSLGHPNALAIYEGDGAGGLQSASSVTGFFQLNDVLTTSADLTGDGRSDLLGLRGDGAGYNSMEVWLNDLQATATATLQNVPIAAGANATHALTCTYGGDSHYATSTSTAVSVSIPAESLSVTPFSGSQTVTAGQTANYGMTITPGGGYTGVVKLSCGSLPSKAACSFQLASVPITSGAVQTTLSIATTAATTSRNDAPIAPLGGGLGGALLAVLLGLGIAPGSTRRWSRKLRALACVALLAALWLPLVGCSGGGSSTTKNPGTPAGTYTVTVTAADSSGTPTTQVQLTLVVQ